MSSHQDRMRWHRRQNWLRNMFAFMFAFIGFVGVIEAVLYDFTPAICITAFCGLQIMRLRDCIIDTELPQWLKRKRHVRRSPSR